MEHKELITKLQRKLGYSREETEAMLDGFCRIVVDSSVQMDTVVIQGLGSFEARKKMERISVNPATGKRMLVPPKLALVFKPNTAIKNRLKERGEHE